jgi:hypothetical protein
MGMLGKNCSPEEIRHWIEHSSLAGFQKELDSAPDEFRYQILAALIADEKRGFQQKALEGRVPL